MQPPAAGRMQQALERRLAVAKAEALQEQQRSSKKMKPNPIEARIPKSKSSTPESTKGQLGSRRSSTFRETPRRSAESHFIYSELDHAMHEKLMMSGNEVTGNYKVVDNILLDMCMKGDYADKFAKGNKSIKLNEVVLLDNVVGKDVVYAEAREEALRSNSKRSRRHMSLREHRKCGSFSFPKQLNNGFDRFKLQHDMWKESIMELLANTGNKQLDLLTANLLGAVFHVVECKTASLKGISGIMIRETTETFGVISQDNRFHVIPKRGSVFIYQAGCWKITLHGDSMIK